ncbi:MAG: hypothetical protein JO297_03895 [Nitrososphaeraceae archaeon]|nr:hypothetical protein [Nitrososphaeraceae archaeon]
MKRLAKNKKGGVVCIFSYWIYYVGPGCIVHLPLTIVGVCVDPVGVGQVSVAWYPIHSCVIVVVIKIPPASVHARWFSALGLENVAVQLPLGSGPTVLVWSAVRVGHVSVVEISMYFWVKSD